MEEYLTQKELCKLLKISPTTVWRWRNEGMPFLKHGNSVRFDQNKVQQWLERKNGNKN
ncbi:MAG TPA: DNA-binding protein [Desulfotomaculum sp.]|nr:DNA-binding protein [Desulfotomaculum sp.]HBY04199.1 DNA-binding protein [Desulfotomaculum sp.]